VARVRSNGSSAASAASGVISSRVWRDSLASHAARQPRLICVEPHQRINLTVVDFSVDEPTASVGQRSLDRSCSGPTNRSCTDLLDRSDPVDRSCTDPLFVVTDGDDAQNGTQTVVCGGQRRRSSVHLSTASCLRLLLNASTARTAEFLIYYEGMQLFRSSYSTAICSLACLYAATANW